MKKLTVLAATFAALTLLGGCGAENAPAVSSGAGAAGSGDTVHMDTLCVELPQTASGDMDAVQKFSDELRTALAGHGVETDAVSVTFGTSEAATVQALESGSVQAAFLSGTGYVKLGRETLAVAAGGVLDEGENADSTDPADWNGETNFTATRNTARAGIRTLLLSGPSDYGAQLSHRVLGGKTPTWTELDHADWGMVAGETTMASQWLEDHYEGNTVEDLSSVTTFDTYADLLGALAGGQVDAAVMAEDVLFYCVDLNLWTAPAYQYVENSSARGLGRENPIWDEVTVLGVSERYFDCVGVVSAADETASSDVFIAAFQSAMLDLSQSHGEDLAAVGLPAMESVTDSQFDGMRRMLAGEE